MSINTITLTLHIITDEPCIITNDPSTEESEGYTQFLQSHNIQFNSIMNPDIDYPSNSDSEAKEVDETTLQENHSINFK